MAYTVLILQEISRNVRVHASMYHIFLYMIKYFPFKLTAKTRWTLYALSSHFSKMYNRHLCNFSVLNFPPCFISDLGSSFWGMVLILASTNLLTARIAAGCFLAALLVTLIVAKNVSTTERLYITAFHPISLSFKISYECDTGLIEMQSFSFHYYGN